MAKPKKKTEEVKKEPPFVLSEEQKYLLSKFYDQELNDRMGLLNNRIIAFVSESKLPLTHALLVLEMVKSGLIEQAKEKFLGEK